MSALLTCFFYVSTYSIVCLLFVSFMYMSVCLLCSHVSFMSVLYVNVSFICVCMSSLLTCFLYVSTYCMSTVCFLHVHMSECLITCFLYVKIVYITWQHFALMSLVSPHLFYTAQCSLYIQFTIPLYHGYRVATKLGGGGGDGCWYMDLYHSPPHLTPQYWQNCTHTD